MKKYELQPTDENILTSLEENILDRNKDLLAFLKMIQSSITFDIISLDGNWGSGKTFFVKQAMMILNTLNNYCKSEQSVKERIEKVVNNVKIRNDILVVYYDAWKNDTCENPIVSIIYEIAKQLNMNFKIQKEKTYKVAASIIGAISNFDINKIIEGLESDDPLSKFKNQIDIDKQFNNFFSEIMFERGEKLIVIIDELDRCNPSFAVKLLEQIKHYVEDERVMFIVTTNVNELQHTVKHYYGEQFDACKYLDKFFSINVKLPPANTTRYYSKLGLNSNWVIDNNCKLIMKEFNMELREASRFIHQVEIAVYEPTHSHDRRFMFQEGQGEEMMLLYIVPIVIGLNIVNKELYNEFINGKNYNPLLKLMKSKDNGITVLRRFLESNESFIEEKGKKVVTEDEIVKRWYNAIFVTDYSGSKYNTVLGGNYEYDSKSKESLLKIISLMSNYAKYE